jgi:hypothetical protein
MGGVRENRSGTLKMQLLGLNCETMVRQLRALVLSEITDSLKNLQGILVLLGEFCSVLLGELFCQSATSGQSAHWAIQVNQCSPQAAEKPPSRFLQKADARDRSAKDKRLGEKPE